MLDWRLLLGHKMRLGVGGMGGEWDLGGLGQEDQGTVARIVARLTFIVVAGGTWEIVTSVGGVVGGLEIAALVVEVGSEVVDMYRGCLLTIGHGGQRDGDAGPGLLEAGDEWRSVGGQYMTTGVASILLTRFGGCCRGRGGHGQTLEHCRDAVTKLKLRRGVSWSFPNRSVTRKWDGGWRLHDVGQEVHVCWRQ